MSLKKRLLFVALLLTFVYVGIEALAFAGYWAFRGESFSFGDVRARQERIVATPLGDPADVPLASGAGGITLHPYLGYVFDPTRTIGFTELNDHGFWGAEGPILKREAQTVNVAIFGGSVAELFFKQGREELVRSMRAEPAFADKRVRVLGFGTGGYKQPQQLLALTYLLGLGAEFDVVINFDGFNEIALAERENVRANVNPFYPRGWKLLAENQNSPDALRRIGAVAAARMARSDAARWCAETPLGWSVLANLIWEFADERLQRRVVAAQDDLAKSASAAQPFAVSGPPTDFGDREGLYDAMVDVWADCSRQMDRLCRANGVRYVHFLQPNQYVEGSKPLSDEERRTAYDESSWYCEPVQLGYPRLRARGAELVAQGVDFHDLTQAFADVEQSLYIDSCCHFSAEGNRLIARDIARAVVSAFPASEDVKLPVQSLTVSPGELELVRPLETRRLEVRGLLENGTSRDVTFASSTTYASGDVTIATVSPFGVVEALRPGEVEIAVRHADQSAAVRVRVEFRDIVVFGRGVLRPDAPRLRAERDGTSVRFTFENVQAGAAVTLLVATGPLRMTLCDAQLFVPVVGSVHLPVAGSELTLQLPESVQGTTFWQAVAMDRRGQCGMWTTDAVAVTVR